MDNVWIVAADSAGARIFTAATPTGPLEEVETFLRPEAPMGQVGGRARAGEAARFAGELAARLEAARAEGRYESLYLLAAPEVLGPLRHRLSPQTAAVLQLEIDKDLTRRDAGEIRAALPERLFSTL
jgi:Protein required for attachment to host cells